MYAHKTPAVTDARGRPIRFFMAAGQVSDHASEAAFPDRFLQPDRVSMLDGWEELS